MEPALAPGQCSTGTADHVCTGTNNMESLRRRAAGQPRIRFVPPVAMPEIAARTNGYDIGLFLLPPVNFNYLHS